MRITVIPADRLVIVDGVPRECAFEAPEGVHAIQFDGEAGVAEMKRGEPQPVTLADMAPYIAAWEAAAPVPAPEPEPVPPPTPSRCTRRQGRLALLEVGLLDDVEALIAAIPDDTQRRAAQIEYEADTWERSNATLQAMWAQLGGTPAELDALFEHAVTT